MDDSVNQRVPAHQDSDPDFNKKARHYTTAYFARATHELLDSGLPHGCVRVVFLSEQYNALYGVHEPVFAVYRAMNDATLVGTYFARALKDFCL